MMFFGHLNDYDITFDATSAIGIRIAPLSIHNVRIPAPYLDCVYGGEPEASPWLSHPAHHDFLLFRIEATPRDLARNGHRTARMGDPRTDENQIVSQPQRAFVQMRKLLITALEGEAGLVPAAIAGIHARAMADIDGAPEMTIQAARWILRRHYQRLILHDVLPSFVDAHVLDKVKQAFAHDLLPAGFATSSPVMQVEFSGAAFRFGHATVQNSYPLNTAEGVIDLFEMGRPEFAARSEWLKIESARCGAVANHPPDLTQAGKVHLPPAFIHEPLRNGGIELSFADSQKNAPTQYFPRPGHVGTALRAADRHLRDPRAQ